MDILSALPGSGPAFTSFFIMLFNSIEYLFFLPVVFLLYWTACRSLVSRNAFLLAASYLFYGWWDYRFLLLIAGMTAYSYVAGRMAGAYGERKIIRKAILWLSVGVCMGTLVVFKYFNFFAAGFSRLLSIAGMTADSVTLDLVLPVGISFYTFQSLSYVIDVCRGSIEPQKKALPFFVFISFFPQLVAGPIERAANLLPQFTSLREFRYEQAASGMKLILWGLFKKMVVADNAAVVVNTVFSDYASAGTLNLWIAAVLFSLQIYGDFSGYSDIAIGTARLFGVNLMRNFRLPYFSRGISDFWRRWHISLTSWFRDYVYIPLGGSRRGKKATVRNTIVVFMASGLWHGANLTFVVWGLYHAILFVPGVIFGRRRGKDAGENTGRLIPPFGESLMMGVTFLLVMIGWVIFRSPDLENAFRYISLMFSHPSTASVVYGKAALAWGAIMLALEWLSRDKEAPTFLPSGGLWSHTPARWCFYVVMFMVTLVCAGGQEEFIYFRF